MTVRRTLAIAGALALVGALAACGGRTSNPVATSSTLDERLSCGHLNAEKTANVRRIEDLRDERVENRKRSLSRVPGAIITANPVSAIALADPSTAIYKEISAIERRNLKIDELKIKKECDKPKPVVAEPTEGAPAPEPIKPVGEIPAGTAPGGAEDPSETPPVGGAARAPAPEAPPSAADAAVEAL